MASMETVLTSNGRRSQRLIALEFNELCPHLLDRWMGEGLLPNFKRLHGESEVYITEADVSDPAQLEPWIQWYSIHTGLPYHQHQVFHLTEGKQAGHADVFRMLIERGRKVTCFGSMNVAPFAEAGSTFVGDPWSENGDAFPASLNSFNRFVSHNVREYSNAANGMGASDYAKFLGFMVANGLRGSTVAKIASQLGTEKLKESKLSWRRVTVLDLLQFDVFRNNYRSHRPDFATFFSNSVAHLQHSYWRHMDPEAFTLRPDAAEMALYGDAILYGYQAMDKTVGKFLTLARQEDAALMFITALSQQPFLRYEETGGQHFYRLYSIEGFLRQMGLQFVDVSPTMTHQYLARFATPAMAEAARGRLEALCLEDGRKIFGFPTVDAEPGGLYFGCQISTKTPSDTPVIDDQKSVPLRFGELFYKIDAIKSGRHHPNGCLWIQTGKHRVHTETTSILNILPTQLEMLGALPLGAEQMGTSLVPQMISA